MADKIDQIAEDVASIKQLLLGLNGNPGLCKNFENLKKDYFIFKTRMIILVTLIASGSGGLGFGIGKLLGGG